MTEAAPSAWRQLLEARHRRGPLVVTLANQKGGVGKTTVAVNLGAALAEKGLRTALIDLDPQGNATTGVGIDRFSIEASVYDCLLGDAHLSDVVRETAVSGLECVPATVDLAGAEIELVNASEREYRLRSALADFSGYDVTLIDCPPSLGLLTVNALTAAADLITPVQCEYYALEGLGQLLKNIDLVKAHLNPGLHVSTIVLTMYDARTRLASQVADEVRAHFEGVVLRTAIPRSVRVSEAPSYPQTVLTYDPSSSGALSYLEAARELAARSAAPPPEMAGQR